VVQFGVHMFSTSVFFFFYDFACLIVVDAHLLQMKMLEARRPNQ
jgi:hypothetical protein